MDNSDPDPIHMNGDEVGAGLGGYYRGNERQKQAKRIFFYRDGMGKQSTTTKPAFVRLAIHPSKYRSLESLLTELTQKMPEMCYGVRSIFTPKGHDRMSSLEDLSSDGIYVCSQFRNKAKGIDLDNIQKPSETPWNAGGIKKPLTNNIRFNTAPLGASNDHDLRVRKFQKRQNGAIRAPASVPESETEQKQNSIENNDLYPRRRKRMPPLPGLRKRGDTKKITVRKNGNNEFINAIFLNRRTIKTFDHLLDDLSGFLMMPVRRLYTLEGERIQSLSAVYNGPDIFVAGGYERFRPMPAWENDNNMVSSRDPFKTNNLSFRQHNTKIGPINRGIWHITINTLDIEPDAGTTANVFITIYGKFRSTAQIPLNCPIGAEPQPGGLFQPGNIREFEICTGNIGNLTKIRIHHDNLGESPDWLIGSVVMVNIDTEDKLEFPFNCWLSRTRINCETCKELPAIYSNNSKYLPVLLYRVSTITGNCWNASCDGKVFLCLYGENGDSGVRHLTQSTFGSYVKPFQKANTDEFKFQCVDLGRLKHLVIGHNAVGPGYGWFLDKVQVQVYRSDGDAEMLTEEVFPCNRWLDHGEEEGKTTLELKPQDNFQHLQLEKEMWQYEKWKFQNGNQVKIYSLVTLKCIQIKENGSVDCMADDKSETCTLEVLVGDKPDICSFKSTLYHPLQLLMLRGQDLVGSSPHKITQDAEFKLRVQPDRSLVLQTTRPMQHQLAVNLHNTSYSSVSLMKGTFNLPAKAFFVYCKGIFREGSIIQLCTSLIQTLSVTQTGQLTAAGKRNRTAHFIVHRVERDQSPCKLYQFESVVLPGSFLNLTTNNCSVKAGDENNSIFKLEKLGSRGVVCIQSEANKGLYFGINLDGSVKPMINTGERNLQFYPEVVKFIKSNKSKPTPRSELVIKQIEKSRSPEMVISYRSELGSSTNTTSRNGQIVHLAELSNEAEEKEYYTEGDWKVQIHSCQTAEFCEIILYIYGDDGCSGPILLGRAGNNKDLFQIGRIDEFKINIPIIGNLFKIRLETHPLLVDLTPFWSVVEVILENIVTEDRCVFPFHNKTFGRGYDDHEISRESAIVTTGDSIPVVVYKIWIFTGTEAGSDCGAPLSITLYGEYGDCGDRELYSPLQDVQPILALGSNSEMTVECVYLGRLEQMLVTIHSEIPDTGWFCNKIIVEDPLTHTQVTFPANQWFDLAKDDGQVCRMLKAEDYKLLQQQGDTATEAEQIEIAEDMYQEAKNMIEHITEQAANHVERFHEMQLKNNSASKDSSSMPNSQ